MLHDRRTWQTTIGADAKNVKELFAFLPAPSLECCPDCHATCLAPCDTHCRPPPARSSRLSVSELDIIAAN